MYRLSSDMDLETFVEEVSAIKDKATIFQICNMATEETYSFSFVHLHSQRKGELLHIGFDQRIEVEESFDGWLSNNHLVV